MRTLLLLFIVVACTSTSSRRKFSDENLDWLDPQVFQKPKLVSYNSSRDSFPRISKYVLSRESLVRLPQSKLDGVTEQEGDDTIRILTHCYRRQFDEAFEIVRREHRRYAKHPGFWNAVGNCYVLQGNRKKAFLFYMKSREINGRYAPALNNIGVVHQQDGSLQKAYSFFDQAVKGNNFSMTPLFNMAQLDLKHGFVDRALASLGTLHRNDSADVDVLGALGAGHLFKGDVEKSLYFYSKIDGQNQKRPDIGVNYALSLYLAGKKSEAKSVVSSVGRTGGELGVYVDRVRRFIREGR